MQRYLADVNVWFALALEEHQHHLEARSWWENTPGLVGFVRVTQLGLLRLLTSTGPMRGCPLTNQQAWDVCERFLSDSRVRVFPDLPALDHLFRTLSHLPQPAPKVWTDAYLAACAVANEAVLVSFDRAFMGYGVKCRILAGEE